MLKIAEHPAAVRLLDDVKGLFSGGRGRISYSLHKHFSFVCGAQGERLTNKKRTLRSEFRDFLELNKKRYQILPIFAEAAIEEIVRDKVGTFLNLGNFEHVIAEVVDSIVIFPESPGSFAELGYFAAILTPRKKTLVVNRAEHQGQSFINFGPLPQFSKDSIYQPIPIVLGANLTRGFKQVAERLTYQTSDVAYRKRFDSHPFNDLTPKSQLVVLFEIIRLFGFVTELNLLATIKHIFAAYDVDRVRRLLAILIAMEFVTRTRYGDYLVSAKSTALFEYERSAVFDSLKARVVNLYQKYDPEAKQYLRAI